MKKTILTICLAILLGGGCTKPAIESTTPSKRAIRIATVKYMLSPEWTVVEWKKEVKYQQYLEESKRWR